MPFTAGRTFGKIEVRTVDNGFTLTVMPPQITPEVSRETAHESRRSLLREINRTLDAWEAKKTGGD